MTLYTSHPYVALALCILAGRLMVRGAFVDVNDLCCWILVKWGGREYAEGSKSRFKGEE
jgi:hypothetical protein